ncbi:MAG TPA: class II aldolase/adducin family protein [Burkholderiaceae bacterium]|nr:class II aldolase/adducin family protein [Burkholderiaceae bacterium]
MQFKQEREHVVGLCLELSRRGYFAGTGGNLMLRIDAETVAVTPSATDYLEMTPADVAVLRLRDLERLDGDRAPSVESSLHARVLRARPEVGCSIHTHQPVASACALLGQALSVPPPWRGTLGPSVPMVGYAPSGSSWLAMKLAGALRPDLNAYLMRNHGILCCGADSAAALRAVDDLEALARHHLAERIANRARSDHQAGLWRVIEALQGLPTTPAAT